VPEKLRRTRNLNIISRDQRLSLTQRERIVTASYALVGIPMQSPRSKCEANTYGMPRIHPKSCDGREKGKTLRIEAAACFEGSRSISVTRDDDAVITEF
jgi:hypothetical protein